jgi:hypothetical protein
MKTTIILCLLVGLATLGGCAGAGPTVVAGLQSEDPTQRIKSAVQAGESKDTNAAPLLVDRLSDSNSDVRFYAILSLRKITGTDMGYHYYDSPGQREQAIGRWRQWLGRKNWASTLPAGGAQ